MPVALITGITGQDGSYLAEFLLAKGYQVVGITRHTSSGDFSRIEHIRDKLVLAEADLQDQGSLLNVFDTHRPDEIYNLGGQSNTQLSWTQTLLTANSTALGVARLLECMRQITPKARFYQASTSEMFGEAPYSPQHENTPFNPRNPYGVAKVYGHNLTLNYRKHFGLFALSGILYNHESPRRGLEFVSRKITNGAAQIKLGLLDKLSLGNIDALRDWGFAGDYVRAMWLMLQQDEPEDIVIGSGNAWSVRDFCNIAFSYLDLDYNDYVVIDKTFYRPKELYPLVANINFAREKLGWQPEVSFEHLVQMMVDADLRSIKQQE